MNERFMAKVGSDTAGQRLLRCSIACVMARQFYASSIALKSHDPMINTGEIHCGPLVRAWALRGDEIWKYRI